MGLTEAERRILDSASDDEQATQDAEDAVAGRKLLERVHGDTIVADAKTKKAVVVSSEEAAKEAQQDHSVLLEEIKEKVQEDRRLALALRFFLQELGEVPLPDWLKVDSMFAAQVDLKGAGCIDIAVTTFGNKIDSLLSLRVAQIAEELKSLDELLQEYKESNKPLPVEKIKERNTKIAALGTVQASSMYAWMITGWSGPMFTWKTGYHNYAAGDTFPLLSTLDYSDDDDTKVASEILRSIPQKALTMIEQGIKILNVIGLESDYQMGN